MRILVARCSVHYLGRGETHLPEAVRLILWNRAGAVSVYSDDRVTPLNWMMAPCRVDITYPSKRALKKNPTAQNWLVASKKERLEISITEVISDTDHVLEEADPGLVRTWTEAHLEGWLSTHLTEVFGEPGWQFLDTQVETGAGTLDMLARDPNGIPVAIEIKRTASPPAVDQCLRYVDALSKDPAMVGVRGMVLALTVKPRARTYADERGVTWFQVPEHLYRN